MPKSDPAAGSALGIECEYVVCEDGASVDFRHVLPELALLPNSPLLPATPSRFRLPDGEQLFCDGEYAEIASPPEPLTFDMPTRLARDVVSGRNALVGLLDQYSEKAGRRYTLMGYSTHLNVQMDRWIDSNSFARRFTLTYGPLLLFLTNVPGARGILCRPRPGRLELATEYISDTALLRASITATIGCFFAFRRQWSGRERPGPCLPETALRPANIRYGWWLPPELVSENFIKDPRKAIVVFDDGTRLPGHQLFERQWNSILSHLGANLHPDEIQCASEHFAGLKPTPLDMSSDPNVEPVRRIPLGNERRRLPSAFVAALDRQRTGEWALKPLFVHWDFIVFSIDTGGPAVLLSVPRAYFAEFAQGDWDGPLSEVLTKLDTSNPLPILTNPDRAGSPGLFSSIDVPSLEAGLEQFPAAGGASPKKKGRQQRKTPKRPKKPRRKDRPCCRVIEENGVIEICVPPTTDPTQVLKPWEPPRNDTVTAHGIWVHNGAFHDVNVDLHIVSRGLDFLFTRHYRSSNDYNGLAGRQWDHGYNIRVVPHFGQSQPGETCLCEIFDPNGGGSSLTYYHGTGRYTEHAFLSWKERTVQWCQDEPGQMVVFRAIVTRYAQNSGDSFDIERYAVLEVLSGSLPECLKGDLIFYRIRMRGEGRIILNCHGYVVQIRDRHHNRMCFEYGPPFNPTTNWIVLNTITDTCSRKYHVGYWVAPDDLIPRINKLEGPHGLTVDYEYDLQRKELKTVKLVKPRPSDPDGANFRPEIQYRYRPSGRSGVLTEIVAPKEAGTAVAAAAAASAPSYLENTYDDDERVIFQRLGAPPGITPEAGGTFGLRYLGNEVDVTDRAKALWNMVLSGNLLKSVTVKDTVFKGGTVQQDQPLTTSYEYDDNCHVKVILHPTGKKERFEYRPQNEPITAGPERDDVDAGITHYFDLSRDDLEKEFLDPAGGGKAFETVQEYEHLFNCVTKRKTPLGESIYRFKPATCSTPEWNGNPEEITHPPQVLPDGNTLVVVERFEYGPGGVRTLFKDPDGVVNTYEHHFTGQVRIHRIGGQRHEEYAFDDLGRIQQRTDNRGIIWTFPEYDQRGNLLRSKDPLSHETVYTYDLNDKLAVKTVTLKDDPTAVQGLPPVPDRTVTKTYQYDILNNRTMTTEKADPFLPNKTGAVSRSWEWRYNSEEREVLARTPRAVAGGAKDAQTFKAYNNRGFPALIVPGYEAGAIPPAPGTATYYTEDGLPGRVVSPTGQVFDSSYDGYDRLIQQTGPDGTEMHRKWEGLNPVREWAAGKISLGPQPGQEIPAILRETEVGFDQKKKLIFQGGVIFDPQKRPKFETQVASGSAETMTFYSAGGRLKKQVDPADREVSYEYDKLGRVSLISLPGGHYSTCFYSGSLPQTTINTFIADTDAPVDPAPPPIILFETKLYDDLGRIIYSEDAQGVSKQTAYDSFGNIRAIRAPLGLKTFVYDGFSRLIRETTEPIASNSATQIVLQYEYDFDDNRIQAQDGVHRLTTVKHDGQGRVKWIEDQGQYPKEFVLRPDGKPEKMTQGSDRSAEFHYYPSGRLEYVDFRNGTDSMRQSYGYDGMGRVTWGRDSNKLPAGEYVEIYRRFDSLGRLTGETTKIPIFGYDQSIDYTFDADHLGRSIAFLNTVNLQMNFGPDGNVKEIAEGQDPILKRWHQGPGRVLAANRSIFVDIKTPSPTSIELPLLEIVSFDGCGRPEQRDFWLSDEINRPGQGAFLGFGGGEELHFGEHGLVDEHVSGIAQTTFEYKYDGAARLDFVRNGDTDNNQLVEYDWDAANRLNTANKTLTKGGVMGKTAADVNIQYRESLHNATTTFGSDRSVVWLFDQATGALQDSQEYFQHFIGVTSGAHRIFLFDSSGRLRRVEGDVPDGEPEYLYDAFGRMVSRLAGSAGTDWKDRKREFFLYDGNRCVADLDKDSKELRRYVYDDAGQLIHYRFIDKVSGQRRLSFPLVTIDGSPWMLVQQRISFNDLPKPPASGASSADFANYYNDRFLLVLEEMEYPPFETPVLWRSDYSFFGTAAVVRSKTQESMLTLGANGKRLMKDERLIYASRRFYDPDLCCFISVDSIGNWGDPGGAGNGYVYAGNNPVNFGDDGNWVWVVLGLVGLALVGGATAVVIDVLRQIIRISEGKQSPYIDKDEVVHAAIAGALLLPAMVFIPELILPSMFYGVAVTGYEFATDQIGWRTAAFDVALLSLPFLSRSGRGAIAHSIGEGTMIGAMRGMGPMDGLSMRAQRISAFWEAPVTPRPRLLCMRCDMAMGELVEDVLYRMDYASGQGRKKLAEGFSRKTPKRVAGTHKHHAVFQYIIRGIQLSEEGANLPREFQVAPPQQELVELGWSTHNSELHPIFDRLLPMLRRRGVGAKGIASLINEGIVYPEELLNILESFYEVVLKDSPEEKDLAIYGVRHVRNSLGLPAPPWE